MLRTYLTLLNDKTLAQLRAEADFFDRFGYLENHAFARDIQALSGMDTVSPVLYFTILFAEVWRESFLRTVK